MSAADDRVTSIGSCFNPLPEIEDVAEDSEVGSIIPKRSTYVDYVPPPTPPLQPPAKYKLWMIIFTIILFLLWLGEEAAKTEALKFDGYLSPDGALFLSSFLQVIVISFAFADFVVWGLTFQIKGKKYGLEPWMKAPRMTWIHKYENVVVEILGCIVLILENGFSIFNPPPLPKKTNGPPSENNKYRKAIPSDTDEREEKSTEVTLKIEHHICPDKVDEYDAWQRKISRVAQIQPGFVTSCVNRHVVTDDETADKRKRGWHRDTVLLTFSSIDTLNDWVTSPARDRLIEELQPLLATENTTTLLSQRHLPDAFTDLAVRQGEFVPPKPPKKWKIVTLTTIALFLSIKFVQGTLPYYFPVWGLDPPTQMERIAINVLFVSFTNVYVLLPLLLMIFSDWLRREENENVTREPWRTLNDGFRGMAPRISLIIVFVVPQLIVVALK